MFTLGPQREDEPLVHDMPQHIYALRSWVMDNICSDTYANYGHIAGIVGICLHIPWTCSGVQ